MEDRDTPGLYLEMTDGPLVAYVDGRVPDVLEQAGAHRATWWENCERDRRDLPRTLPDFDFLAVYEVDESFRPPAANPLAPGLLYRRTTRPGQGRLTGNPTIGLSLVLISARTPGGAQSLRDWADFVHLRHIAEVGVPGYSMVTPYEHATGGEPRFMHFYEMDTEDPEAAFQAMTPLVAELLGAPGEPAFDHWARHPELRIDYVNSFRRLGDQSA